MEESFLGRNARAGHSFKTALIVDDHPLFCDALSITIKLVSDITCLETASNLQEALDVLKAKPTPDIIFFDLNLPEISGLEGLIRLRAHHPDIPVIVVSSESDNRTIAASLAAGAAGFVPKHSHRDVFRAALDKVGQGQTYLPEGYMMTESEAKDSADMNTNEQIARIASLTRQQSRILELVCEGRLNKQIAYELSISEATVKAHVTAIMRKLKVHNRTQAVIVAQKAKHPSRDNS